MKILRCSHFALILLAAVAVAQTPTPAPPPAYSAPAPHKNAPHGEIPRMPGDGAGAYKTGHYRDLFAEAGHTPAESSAKIEKAFQQLFHGDGQYERLYFETGANVNGPLAYVTDWANNDARTEGMSYGMMIAVQLDKKREFDALWNWANTYMLVTDPKNPTVGYFAWSMATDNSPRSTGPAPDGEEYFVMSLYFAAHRWGNGKGIYDYRAQADKILRGMRHHPVLTGTGPFRIHPEDPPFLPTGRLWPSPNNDARMKEMATQGVMPPEPTAAMLERIRTRIITSGAMTEEAHTMIRFVPEGDGSNEGVTDASYHLPAFYELWARWGPEEDRTFWAKAADVSRQLFVTVTGPNTGLTPERSNFDMTPVLDRSGNPATFGYDSWRSVSNWSVDYSWWQKDTRQTVLSDRVQTFLASQEIDKFVDRYTLEGQPLSQRHSTGMLATTAVGSLGATPGATSKAFVEALWNTPIPSGEQRYYDGMLYVMSLMHASGNFRIWQVK